MFPSKRFACVALLLAAGVALCGERSGAVAEPAKPAPLPEIRLGPVLDYFKVVHAEVKDFQQRIPGGQIRRVPAVQYLVEATRGVELHPGFTVRYIDRDGVERMEGIVVLDPLTLSWRQGQRLRIVIFLPGPNDGIRRIEVSNLLD